MAESAIFAGVHDEAAEYGESEEQAESAVNATENEPNEGTDEATLKAEAADTSVGDDEATAAADTELEGGGGGESTAADDENGAQAVDADEEAARFIRLRGLPFSATEDDVRVFFTELPLKKMVFTQGFGGKPSGECYVELDSADEAERALAYDHGEMKGRYIEVFTVSVKDLERMRWRERNRQADTGCVVRLRGMPFGCLEQDIRDFFEGLEPAADGILIALEGGNGRPTGEAYVRFVDRDTAEKAFAKHMQNMGHRYIEVFRSTADEMKRANAPPPFSDAFDDCAAGDNSGPCWSANPHSLLDMPLLRPPPGWTDRGGGGNMRARGPYPLGMARFPRGGPRVPPPMARGRGMKPVGGFRGRMSQWNPGRFTGPQQMGGGAIRVHMRGLPFKATEKDVREFFAPLPVMGVYIDFNERGQASGDGWADFPAPGVAAEAMQRHKSMMGHRYIDLKLDEEGDAGEGDFGYFDNTPPMLPHRGRGAPPWMGRGVRGPRGGAGFRGAFAGPPADGAFGGPVSAPMGGYGGNGYGGAPVTAAGGAAAAWQQQQQGATSYAAPAAPVPLVQPNSGLDAQGNVQYPQFYSNPQPAQQQATPTAADASNNVGGQAVGVVSYAGEQGDVLQQYHAQYEQWQQYWQQHQAWQASLFSQQQAAGMPWATGQAPAANAAPPPPPPPPPKR